MPGQVQNIKNFSLEVKKVEEDWRNSCLEPIVSLEPTPCISIRQRMKRPIATFLYEKNVIATFMY
jgi:hypothetical protein